ncbi:MAG: ABC transporter ATP-binding protein [Acidiferrobacterales bacterium]|nr:ABC transporter ATP-binding protein [Acidiferrobacterales bacterium]
MSTDTPLLALKGITKAFPGVVANDSVDFEIAEGEIHALLGENGAGKSTLVKIIYGYYSADAGTMNWQGEPVKVSSPAHARQMGIGMVFQHFSLFEAMSVRENIELAVSSGKKGLELADEIRTVSDTYGLGLDPERDVFSLSVGERQRVEIVRCLLQSPKLLIMDEPTSVLTPQESDKLFAVLRKLADQGCAVLYISHKLEEIRVLCHHATILRHGKVVTECDPTKVDTQQLAEMMIGKSLKAPTSQPKEPGKVVFSVRNLSRTAESERNISLKDIDFEVRAGEIFGIAGVAGNGQTELMGMLSGEVLADLDSSVCINSVDCGRYGVRARRELGMASVPEERLGHGVVGNMSLTENVFLSGHKKYDLSKNLLMHFSNARRFSQKICDDFDVRHAGIHVDASSLSGGNLQKFLMGREILQHPAVMIASQPTWGIDAGSQAAIHQSLIDLAQDGAAVVVISQDLDELMGLCDRISVMFAGQLSESHPVAGLTAQKIGLLMGGAQVEADQDAANAH